jgi:hypothetical protein
MKEKHLTDEQVQRRIRIAELGYVYGQNNIANILSEGYSLALIEALISAKLKVSLENAKNMEMQLLGKPHDELEQDLNKDHRHPIIITDEDIRMYKR